MATPPAAFAVHDLQPADEAAVQQLFAASTEWFESATGGPSGPADVQSLFYSLPEGANPADKQLLVIAASGGNAVAGLVDVVLRHPDDTTASCGLFLIDPGARRSGLGTAVVAELLGRARAHGIRTVTLTLPKTEAAGREFAKKLGFVEGEAVSAAPFGPTLLRASLTL